LPLNRNFVNWSSGRNSRHVVRACSDAHGGKEVETAARTGVEERIGLDEQKGGPFMKKLVALAALSLVGGLLATTSAVADDTHCIGALTGTFDNVVVPPAARCTISDSTVRGNVKALENSQLVIQQSNIRGNVEGDKADLVQVNSSMVRGNILIKEGGPAVAPFPAGAVICLTNVCEALVFVTTVEEGNVQIEKMTGDAVVSFARILKGNAKVEDNFIPAGDALAVLATPIAQNLQVFKNKGPGTFKQVTGNTVGESIQCFENDPPFVGGPNTAPKKEGQCF
jgi:hypothetical protein